MQDRLRAHRASEPHGSTLGPVIHDIVYGAHDGIITTFAVVAGTVGADLPVGIIVILGMANLLADGVSMGAGSFLSIKSERDQYQRLYKEELKEIEIHPELEREEVKEAFAAKGFQGEDLERAVAVLTRTPDVWAQTMMREEHGLTDASGKPPLVHAIATFLGFVLFGSIPLLPYLLGASSSQQFAVAIFSTIGALLAVGATRSLVTRERIVRGSLEILGIGLATAVIAFVTGVLLRGVVNVAL